MTLLQATFFLPFNMQPRAPSRKNFYSNEAFDGSWRNQLGGGNLFNASGHFSPSSSKQSLVRPFPCKSSGVRTARSALSLSNEGLNAPSCFRLKGNINRLHCRGYRDHVQCHVTFVVNKPRKFGHWVNHPLPLYELRLRHFVVNNFQCREEISMLKIDFFFCIMCLIIYQASWYFATAIVDAKTIARSVPAWNNHTSSACVR